MAQPICVGLDRDGTINVDKGYIKNPNDLEPIPGSLESIRLLREKGFDVVILSNQSGIMKNELTPADVDNVNGRLLEMLGSVGCRSINALYYATSNLKDDYYPKHNIGMFERCEKENGISFQNGYFVGDKISDLKAAVKAKATPVLVLTGHGQDALQKLDSYANKDLKKKTKVYDDLKSFVEDLIKT